VYVGNISFYTSDSQIRALFSRAGTVKNVIMGIDKIKKTQCGFCFVEFESHEEAIAADVNMSGIVLDGQPIKVEIDWGFSEGRQYGRSFFGGQVRDAFRVDFNANRGGYGELIKRGIKQPGEVDFDYRNAMASTGDNGDNGGGGKKRVRMDDSLPSNRRDKRSRHENSEVDEEEEKTED
jgi:nuclear cap-binding protein subunit 2